MKYNISSAKWFSLALLLCNPYSFAEPVELEAAESEISELDAAGSEISELEAAESEISELDAAGSEISELEAAGSEISELDAAGSEISELEAAESEISELERSDTSPSYEDPYKSDDIIQVDPSESLTEDQSEKLTQVDLSKDRLTRAQAHLTFLRESAVPSGKKRSLWKNLSSKIKSSKNDYLGKLIRDINNYLMQYRDLEISAEALLVRANIHNRQQEYPAQVIDLLKIIFEYPDTDYAENGRQKLLELIGKKMKKNKKEVEIVLNATIANDDRATRFAYFLEAIALLPTKTFGQPKAMEFDEFMTRHPSHPKADLILELAAKNYRTDKLYDSSVHSLRRMIALYPNSPKNPLGQITVAEIREKSQQLYQQAEKAYVKVYSNYPESPEALRARQQLAKMHESKTKQYKKALAEHEEIIRLFTEQRIIVQSLNRIARIHHSHTKNYKSEIEAYQRIVSNFPGDDAAKALLEAAKTAKNNLKDYPLLISLNQQFVRDYGDRPEVEKVLYDIATAYDKNLKDSVAAIASYQKVVDRSSDKKLRSKAQKRIDKLSK